MPPHIAIVGAGPTGLEAALAAADAGRSFTLYEAGDAVAEHLLRWQHVRLFSPWELDLSPRMRSHLAAAGRSAPSGEACPTGGALRAVLQQIAALPAVNHRLRLGARVLAIGREGLLKHQAIANPARATHPFRLLVLGADGVECIEHADIVLDCTGTYGQPNATGDGGIPAPGEAALGARVRRQIPDFEAEEKTWAGQRILLVGAGHSAQTAACDLQRLVLKRPGTGVVWALRRTEAVWPAIEDDALPARSALIAAAQQVAQAPPEGFCVHTGVVVERLAHDAHGIHATLRRQGGGCFEVAVDRIVSLTGFVPDHQLYRQLQVHECYATCGPIKLAAALLGESSSDCLEQSSHGADTLANPEPGFFILGAKSYGRNATFLMRVGWQQVAEVFALLAEVGDARVAGEVAV